MGLRDRRYTSLSASRGDGAAVLSMQCVCLPNVRLNCYTQGSWDKGRALTGIISGKRSVSHLILPGATLGVIQLSRIFSEVESTAAGEIGWAQPYGVLGKKGVVCGI